MSAVRTNQVDLLKVEDLELREISGSKLPPELIALRQSVYRDEVGYLSDATVTTADDKLGVILGLYRQGTNELLATAQIMPAEHGEFQRLSNLPATALRDAAFLTRCMVQASYRQQGLFTMMVYLAFQRARLWGKKAIVCYASEGEIPAAKVMGYERCVNLPIGNIYGHDGKVFHLVPVTVNLAKGIIRAYEKTPAHLKSFLMHSAGDEASQTVNKRLDQFFENPFFKTIEARALTRQQYIATLNNMHQFVRHTTRILARAISISDDKTLRRHFIEHMNGEIDHEVMIEKDLNAISEDVSYLVNHMVPNYETQQFMVIQESFLGYHNDPIQYLTVPYSIEGFSARLDEKFLQDLEACIASWGFKAPKRATRFLSSHIVTDGGDDGHWAKNQEIASHCIKNEMQLQRFLNGIHLTMDSLERCYAAFVGFTDYTVVAQGWTDDYTDAIPAAPGLGNSTPHVDSLVV